MNCSATSDCGELVCFVFVFCHSQNDPSALCREMEKGISGCSTLTKLSLLGLPPQCASASVRAAMALQSSLTKVEWSRCSFRSKSNIGVTVLACCVWCVHGCVVRDRGRGGRIVCVNLHAFDLVSWCTWVHVCVRMFEMYLHCVCASLCGTYVRRCVCSVVDHL